MARILFKTDKEIIQEINRLSSAFGIGGIKLNLTNCEESEILFPSMRKRVLDGETMNKLFTINIDFHEFVQATIDSIKINHPVVGKFDSVLSKVDLKEILQNSIKTDISNREEFPSVVDNNKYADLNTDYWTIFNWINNFWRKRLYLVHMEN